MKSPNEKTLIILDNDQTLIDKTCMYYVAETLFTKEEYEYFCNENAKDKKISLSKLTSTVESTELTKGMKELFEFLRENKEKNLI